MAPLLETKGLSRHFGGLRAIHALDIQVQHGQLLGVIGPNGAGKSTLLALISGVLPPSAGHVLLEAQEISGKPAHVVAKHGIARTFQANRSFQSLNVRENLDLAAFTHCAGAPGRGSVADAIEMFDLGAWRTRMPGDLPWGVQRRLEIARAYLRRPRLLLLDEPAAGMNEAEVDDLARVLRLLRASGITMMLVEHVMDLVMPLCDRIIVLDHGEKIAEGTPQEISVNERALEAYLG